MSVELCGPAALPDRESGVARCREMLADKRFHDVLRCSEQLLEAHPDAPDVIHCRSDVLHRLLRFEEAIGMLEDAVSRLEDSALYEDLARHCMLARRTDAARRACLEGLSRFPSNGYLLKTLYDIDSSGTGKKRRRGFIGRIQRMFAKLTRSRGEMEEWRRYFEQAIALPGAVQKIAGHFSTEQLHSLPGSSGEVKRIRNHIRTIWKCGAKWRKVYDPRRVALEKTPGLPQKASMDAVFRNNALMFRDVRSVRCSVENGARVVVRQPAEYEYTVFLAGYCMMVHAWCDSLTLGSAVQDVFNERTGGKVRVVMYGGQGELGCSHNVYLQMFYSEKPRPGDKVLYYDISPDRLPAQGRDGSAYEGRMLEYASFRNELAGMGVDLYLGFSPSLTRDAYRTRKDDRLYEALRALGRAPSEEEAKAAQAGFVRGLRDNGFAFAVFDEVLARKKPDARGRFWKDTAHYSVILNWPLAEAMYDFLARPVKRVRDESLPGFRKRSMRVLQDTAFAKFMENRGILSWIAETYDAGVSSRENVGAIVMNCNPFTLGHRYLVEKALESADALYLFVVEENLSQFSFADRLRLVKEGVREFGDRVHVVPSGKFIISSFSFAGYFTKAVATEPADSTTDLLIFAAMIAPALNIRTRFVGEEPTCLVTRAYNERMEQMLPDMGCAVRVIPRKESGGAAISASRVRKALEDGDLESIRDLVPETTYIYLQNTLVNT